MVGKIIRKWLGIDALERENLTLAKASKAAHRRITELSGRVDKADFDALECLELTRTIMSDRQKELTSEPAKPKIVAKPQRTSWKQFRSVAEKATDPEREEA